MANLNKVLLIGRLTRDPEVRYIPSGAGVTEFGLAVNRYYNSQSGERKEDTCYLEVSAWGRLGETVKNYLTKGRQVFVEGHLTYSEWQNQEGKKRSRIRVTADNIQFLDSGRADGSRADGSRADGGRFESEPRQQRPPMDQGVPQAMDQGVPQAPSSPPESVNENVIPGEDTFDDDCPF